jgi:hypothetical protein
VLPLFNPVVQGDAFLVALDRSAGVGFCPCNRFLKPVTKRPFNTLSEVTVKHYFYGFY